MKKLMKLLIATALVLTMAVCFAACGGKTMNTAIVYEEDPVAVATQTGQLNDFTDWLVSSHSGEWVVFYEDTLAYKTEGTNQVRDPQNDTRTYKLYNAATEKVAASKSVKRGKTGFQLPYSTGEYLGVSVGVEISRVDSEIVIKTVYYDEQSVSVGSVKQNEIVTNDTADLAKIGDYIFKVVDDKITHVENKTASIASIDEYVIDEDGNVYYYDINYTGVTAYDANMNLYGFVKVPSYAEEAMAYTLANGNVLIQYVYATDWTGDDYEIIEDGAEKANLVTILYNLEKNTAKEIKLDYAVRTISSEGLAEKVDNIAMVYAIEDNRINMNEDALIYCEINNNGKVGTVYGKAEDYLVNAGLYAVAEGRYMARSISGEMVLYNEEMEKITTFSAQAHPQGQYIVDGKKFYNTDGNLVADTAEYIFVRMFDNGNAIYKKYDENNSSIEYWLLAKGTFAKVATEWEEEVIENKNSGEMFELFGDNYYVITKWTKNATTEEVTLTDYVYNMNGDKLTETVAYVPYVDYNATEDEGTMIYDRTVVTEAEGLLVFSVEVVKFNSAKEDDVVIGYETFTEYYYCK